MLTSLPRKLARPETPYELSTSYDLFMRYTAASAEAYPEKEHLTQLLKELNSIRDSKRRLITSSKKDKKTKPAEPAQAAG